MRKTLITLTAVAVASTSAFAAGTAACKGCHGQNFEKKAMNVSKVVKDMSKADIVTSLKGYKAGTYGGNMKGIMAGQVKSLDDAAIEAIATEIAGEEKKEAAAPAAAVENKAVDSAAAAVEKKAAASATDAVVDMAKEKAAEVAADVAKEAVNTAVDAAKAKATEEAAGSAAKMMMK
jgi:cytochrome c-type protein NapB